jgi:hypothetical protein
MGSAWRGINSVPKGIIGVRRVIAKVKTEKLELWGYV